MAAWELLAPARDLECVEAALRFGADAVYLGGPQLQLRAASSGFSLEEIGRAAGLLHARGKRLYVTVNAFPKDAELDALPGYIEELKGSGVDAVIVADLGALSVIRSSHPDMELHVSTQANCQNYAAANAYAALGAARIVLGRELSLEDIASLRRRTPPDLQLEAFVHGAMCMAYSGRCLISAALTGRSANRGACTQSCRWNYYLMEEKRPGQYFPVFEDERGTTLLSSHDLCALPFLEKVIESGVTSFKIEGRMKSAYYVATVVNAYRKRLDAIKAKAPVDTKALMDELRCASHRSFSSGFYFSEAIHQAPDDGQYRQDCVFVGTVRAAAPRGRVRFEARNRLPEGTSVEILSPSLTQASFIAENISDSQGARVTCADRPSELYEMDCPYALEEGDMLRVRA